MGKCKLVELMLEKKKRSSGLSQQGRKLQEAGRIFQHLEIYCLKHQQQQSSYYRTMGEKLQCCKEQNLQDPT
jgi:hypothetical protein